MSLKISRILHAGYLFEHNDATVIFDPIFENPFSGNCYAFPDVRFDLKKIKDLKFDAVFISHYHDDHCSFDSLNLINRNTPIYLYCIHDELFSLIAQLGFKQVHKLSLNIPVKIKDLEVIPRLALDPDVDSIFEINAGPLKILNVVDSWIDPNTIQLLAKKAPWDLVLWPFQTMREIDILAPTRASNADREIPTEWLEQLQELKPRFVIPSSCQFQQESWSWYNHALFPITYEQFTIQVQGALPPARIIRMNPGFSLELTSEELKNVPPLNWLQPQGEQNMDYDYREKAILPATAEIAQHLAPLSETAKQRVHQYCQSELPTKYRTLETSQDPYFSKPRHWRLTLYDHKGMAQHYSYLLDGSSIEITQDPHLPLSWTTEVPAAKLFAALENGEALTSMYARINDFIFEKEIEQEIQTADTLEDPLVRCLFTGVFGAYQKAQLKHLKTSGALEIP